MLIVTLIQDYGCSSHPPTHMVLDFPLTHPHIHDAWFPPTHPHTLLMVSTHLNTILSDPSILPLMTLLKNVRHKCAFCLLIG